MADKTSEQEPSIEEILASIRQIITDDDEQPPAASKPSAPPPPPEPEPEPLPADDVFDLTADMQAMTPAPAPSKPAFVPEPEPIIDLMEEAPAPAPRPRAEPEPDMSDILSDRTRQATLASMARLAGNMPINRPKMGVAAVTLEDIVREMLHPMLRDWMDGNLSPMVERLVQKELEKLARKALDE